MLATSMQSNHPSVITHTNSLQPQNKNDLILMLYSKLFNLYQSKDSPAPSIAHLESRQHDFKRLLARLNSIEEEGNPLLHFDFPLLALESKNVIPFFQDFE